MHGASDDARGRGRASSARSVCWIARRPITARTASKDASERLSDAPDTRSRTTGRSGLDDAAWPRSADRRMAAITQHAARIAFRTGVTSACGRSVHRASSGTAASSETGEVLHAPAPPEDPRARRAELRALRTAVPRGRRRGEPGCARRDTCARTDCGRRSCRSRRGDGAEAVQDATAARPNGFTFHFLVGEDKRPRGRVASHSTRTITPPEPPPSGIPATTPSPFSRAHRSPPPRATFRPSSSRLDDHREHVPR